MKTRKEYNSLVTSLLFVAAIGLLLFSSIGSTRAALIESTEYVSQFQFPTLRIALSQDSGKMFGMLKGDDKLIPGKKYPVNVTVSNTGSVDEYTRVTIYRYWLGKDGKQDTTLDAKLIQYEVDSSWKKDDTKSTDEMSIFYYTGGKFTGSTALLKSVTLDEKVLASAKQTKSEPGLPKGRRVRI